MALKTCATSAIFEKFKISDRRMILFPASPCGNRLLPLTSSPLSMYRLHQQIWTSLIRLNGLDPRLYVLKLIGWLAVASKRWPWAVQTLLSCASGRTRWVHVVYGEFGRWLPSSNFPAKNKCIIRYVWSAARQLRHLNTAAERRVSMTFGLQIQILVDIIAANFGNLKREHWHFASLGL